MPQRCILRLSPVISSPIWGRPIFTVSDSTFRRVLVLFISLASVAAPAHASEEPRFCDSAEFVEGLLLGLGQRPVWEGDFIPNGKHRFRLYVAMAGPWAIVRAPKPFPESGSWNDAAVCVMVAGRSSDFSADVDVDLWYGAEDVDRLTDIAERWKEIDKNFAAADARLQKKVEAAKKRLRELRAEEEG